jgi:hypothetical protein
LKCFIYGRNRVAIDTVIHGNGYTNRNYITEYERDDSMAGESYLEEDRIPAEDIEYIEDSRIRIPRLHIDTIVVDCSPINFIDTGK